MRSLAAAVVLGALLSGCAPVEDPIRTPSSAGAVRMRNLDAFAQGYRPGVEALAGHMRDNLDIDPGEYYVNVRVERGSGYFHFTAWHRAAFEPEHARVSNPGGRCFRISWDPQTGAFSAPDFWP